MLYKALMLVLTILSLLEHDTPIRERNIHQQIIKDR